MNVYQDVSVNGDVDVIGNAVVRGNVTGINALTAKNIDAVSFGSDAEVAIEAMIRSAYPVGSIYISTINNSPANFIGGNWEQIKDTFLLAAGTTYPAGTSGGSADAVVVEHNHGSIYASGGVNDGYLLAGNGGSSRDNVIGLNSSAYTINRIGQFGEFVTRKFGTSGTGKNMPPYIAVYMWKRIA